VYGIGLNKWVAFGSMAPLGACRCLPHLKLTTHDSIL
jgi:hypothetical protein